MDSSMESLSFIQTDEGLSIKWRGRFLYSSRHPLKKVEKILGKIALEENTLYLLPSPLLCYGLESLLSRLPSHSHVLGLETDEYLFGTLLPHIPTCLLSQSSFSFVRTQSFQDLCRFVDNLNGQKFRRCRMIVLNGAYDINRDFYDKAELALQRHIQNRWQTELMLMKMGRLWFGNIFSNLPQLGKGCFLTDFHVDANLMLCGAGESLEQAIPIIRKYRHKLFLITVDTAYPTLLEEGIVPDGVFNLDGQFYNNYDFYRHKDDHIFLFSDITCYPGTLRLPGVTPVFFSSQFSDSNLLSRLKESEILPSPIPPLGSVGVTALYLTLQLGDSPIILSGLDFSYVPGKSHAHGTLFHHLYLQRNRRISPDGDLIRHSYERPGVTLQRQHSGGTIRSDKILKGYFDLFVSLAKENQSRLFNLAYDYPSLGIPVIGEEDLVNIIRDIPILYSFDGTSDDVDDRVLRFLENEVAHLKALIDHWDVYSRGGSDKEDRIHDLLEPCDYLMPSLVKNERDIVSLTQAVKAARRYKIKMERIVHGLRYPPQ